jgi:membrane associated rhomboid family serine protease
MGDPVRAALAWGVAMALAFGVAAAIVYDNALFGLAVGLAMGGSQAVGMYRWQRRRDDDHAETVPAETAP